MKSNKLAKRTITLAFVIIGFTQMVWSQSYPVDVQGQIIPPYNMRFADYFDNQANNLLFTIELRDPIEETRNVRLRLSVESNGAEILGSNRLFQPEIITLEKNIPQLLTGNDLQLYFQDILAQNSNIPEYLPEGFNGICVEVIDIETNKIISNKGCATGFFNFSNPPQLQSPVCGADIEQTETQNILFNWLAMHNASGNPITDVEYEFTLVEVPEYIQNPKDAFDLGGFVFQNTYLNTTSFFYTEGEPLLEQGKQYAWRVKASALDPMTGDVLPLFENNGFSEICIFNFSTPTAPPDPLNFSTCIGNECNYLGSIDDTPKGEAYFSGDKVDVGYFELEFATVEYNNSDESYAGTGIIFVEFLGTNVQVEFSDIQINIFDRVSEGEIKAIIGDESVLPSNFIGDFISINPTVTGLASFSDEEAVSLSNFFDQNPTQLISTLQQQGEEGNAQLPIGFDTPIPGLGKSAIITIADMKFTARKAEMNCIHINQEIGEVWSKFGGKGICIRQNGLVDDEPRLYILDEMEIVADNGFGVILETKSTQGAGTYMEWNCNGFQTYNIQGRHELNKEKIQPSDNNDKVFAQFSASTNDLSEFKAEITNITPFHINGLSGFDFEGSNGWIDFSKQVKLSENELVEESSILQNKGKEWIGIYLQTPTINLPSILNILGEEAIIGSIKELILDDNGLTTAILFEEILKADEGGNLAGMPISLDKLKININENEISDSSLEGSFGLPILDDDQMVSFTGGLVEGIDLSTGEDVFNIELVLNQGTYQSELLRSTLNIGEKSKLSLQQSSGLFQAPKIELNGNIAININPDDLGFGEAFSESLSVMESLLEQLGQEEYVNQILTPQIPIKDFILDYNADVKLSFLNDLTLIEDIDLLGLQSALFAIGVNELTPKSNTLAASFPDVRDIGLVLTSKFAEEILGDLAPDISFIIRLEEDSRNILSYNFSGFEIDGSLPEFELPTFNVSCSNDLSEIDITNQDGINNLDELDAIQVGHFAITDWTNITKNGAGRFTGEGKINIPALGPLGNINVEFDNVLINQGGRIVDGIVQTKEDAMFASTQLSDNPTALVNSIQTKIDAAINVVNESFSLPLVLGVEIDETIEQDQGLIITSLDFNPQGANMSAKVLIPVGNGEFAEFSATGLNIVPDGIAGIDLIMGLADDFSFSNQPGQIPLHFEKYQNGTGSFISLDCDGLVEFNLKGKYTLPEEDYINVSNPSQPIQAAFNINTPEWGEFIGEIEITDEFEVVGLEDFRFKPTTAFIDYSTLSNPENIEFPEEYENTDRTWQGLYLPTVGMDIPSALSNGEISELSGEHLFIDNNGLSTNFTATNLIDLGTSDLGGWNFSMDNFSLVIEANTLNEASFSGGIQLPIMKGNETMPYEAACQYVTLEDGTKDYDIDFKAIPTEIEISLLQSKIEFDSTSIITIGRVNGEWTNPYANLSGDIKFDIEADENDLSEATQDVLSQIDQFLQDNVSDGVTVDDIIPKLKSEVIRFDDMVFDLGSPTDKFSIGSITPINTSIEFLGMNAGLTDINLSSITLDTLANQTTQTINQNAKYLGFNFETKLAEDILGGLAPTIKFSLNIEEEPFPNGRVNYDFFSYNLDFIPPNVDFSCTSNLQSLVIGEDSYTGTLAANDIVQVGRFEMKINEVTGTNGDFSGTGIIEVPVLGPVRFLNVAFDELDLDSGKNMKSGNVITQTDGGSWASTPEGLTGLMATASEKINSAASSFELPVIMGDVEEDGYAFTIMGLNFGREKTSLEARFIVDIGGNTYAEFIAEGLEIVPTGIASMDIVLGLASDLDLMDAAGIPLTFKAYDTANATGSSVQCDCDGFQSFNLEGFYQFDEDGFVNIENPNEPVTASFNLSTETWGEFLGQVEAIDTFFIVGIDDFKFKTTTAYLDYSASANATGISFPEGYTDTLNTWKGLYIPEIRVDIPESFTGGEKGFFLGENLLLDSEGASANLYGENILSIEDGDLAGWAFSMDSLYINLSNNSLENGGFQGGIQLPIMIEGESMPYKASFTAVSDSTGISDYDMDFQAIPIPLEISLLKSTITFDDNSIFTVGRQNGEWQLPYLEMSGNINFNINADANSLPEEAQESLAEVTTFLVDNGVGVDAADIVPRFQSEGIRFENFVLDMGSDTDKFSIGAITPINTSLEFLGVEANLNDIGFAEINPDSLMSDVDSLITEGTNTTINAINENAKYLGFSFETKVAEDLLGGLAPTVRFALNIEEEPLLNGKVNYDFFSYDLDFEAPDIDLSCTSNLEPLIIEEDDFVGTLSVNDRVKVGRFEMEISELTQVGNTYEGKGIIEVPVLGPVRFLKVDFDDLELNSQKEMKSGNVVTKTDGNSWSSTPEGLSGLMATASEKINSVMSSFELPVVLGDVEEDGVAFTIVGLNFGKEETSLEARLVINMGEGEYAEFKAQGLEIVPTGIASIDINLGLAADLDMENLTGLPIIFNQYDADANTGSFATCDCDGFQSFQLEGKYVFGEDYENLENPNEPVEAAFNFSTEEWGEFIGQVEEIDSFAIANMEGFGFKASAAYLDYSEENNAMGMTFPQDYTDTLNTWKGIYIPEIRVDIPESFTGGTTGYFTGQDLLLDSEGMSANMVGENILDMNDGDMAGWKFSMDSIYVNISNNSLENGGFQGGIRLPIMVEGESMPYEASFAAVLDSTGVSDYDMNFQAIPAPIDISLLKSTITFDDNSIFTVGRQNGEWQLPYLEMSGNINFNINADVNSLPEDAQESLADVTDFLVDNGADIEAVDIIPRFQSEGIRFENFILDMGSDTSKFSIGAITPINTSLEFLGMSADLNGINFKKINPDSLMADANNLVTQGTNTAINAINENAQYLGFSFETKVAEDLLGALAPTVSFSLNIEEEPLPNGEVNYEFFSYDLDFQAPDVNFSCVNSEVLSISNIPYTGQLAGVDSLQVGRFWMRDIDLTSDNNGTISGTGKIRVPILGPLQNLNVSFTDATFNADKQLMTGEIITSTEDGSWATTPDLNGLMGKASEKIGDVANSFDLPLIMGDTSDGYVFTFVGLSFQPQETKLKARLLVDVGEDTYAEFFAEGLNVVPNGIAGVDLRLGLAEDLDLESLTGAPLSFKKYEESDSTGSYVVCDCDGFQSFRLDGSYILGKEDYKNLENPDEDVEANFSIYTEEWGEFLGQVESIDSFEIVGVDGFVFSSSNAYIDFSSSQNNLGMTFPEGYVNTGPEWKGFYMAELNVGIPTSFTGGEPGSFTGTDLMIDNGGVTANLLGENVLDISDGDMAGWKFSMDSIYLNIDNNVLEDGGFQGGIRLPIMVEEESMPYEASFTAVSDSTGVLDYNMNFQAIPAPIDISLLKSTITFDDNSIFTVGRENGEWQLPYLEMSGNINFDIDADASSLPNEAQNILADITEFLVDNGLDVDAADIVPRFQSEGIRFENFILDMNSDTSKFSIGAITPINTGIEFLGSTSELSGIDFLKLDADSLVSDATNAINDNAKYLGFSFETKVAEDFLGGLAPTVRFALNIEEEPIVGGGVNYSFFSYDLEFEAPNVNMSCTNNLPDLVIKQDNYNQTLSVGDSLTVGRFQMNISEITSDDGAGTISGKGVMDVPILGPLRNLNVEFTDVIINSDKQMRFGSMVTKSEDGDWTLPSTSLGGLMSTAVNKISSVANSFELPVVMGDPEEDGYAFTIVGLNFGVNTTSLEARFIVKTGDNEEDYLEFKANGLNIVPNGIAGVDLRLALANDFSLEASTGIPLRFAAYNDVDDTGSYVLCDCDGFQSFNLAGNAELPIDIIQSRQGLAINEEVPVVAEFNINSESWGEFMGELIINDTTFIPGLEDIPIILTEAYMDLSSETDPSLLQFPQEYEGASTDGTWKGFYMPAISMQLPEVLSNTSDENVPLIEGLNFVIDSTGFSGRLLGTNLISADVANIGGLGFSMDSVVVELTQNNLQKAQFLGGIQLPMMEADEMMPYEGNFFITQDSVTNENFLDFSFEAKPEEVRIDLLRSTFNFDSTSVISIVRENGNFSYPIIDLSGSFKLDITSSDDAFSEEFLADVQAIEEVLEVDNLLPQLNLDSITFSHFRIDPNSDEQVFSIDSIVPVGFEFGFLGMDWDLSEITFDDVANLGMDIDIPVEDNVIGTVKNLGLAFDFELDVSLLPRIPASFAILIDETREGDDISYSFEGFEFDYTLPELPSFTCDSEIAPDTITDQTAVAMTSSQNVIVGRFQMNVESLTSSNASGNTGTGIIRIPFLGYDMKVSFEGIQVNAAGQLIAGEILTDTEGSLIPDEAASTEGTSIPFIGDSPELEAFLQSTQEFFTLPISISEKLQEIADIELPEGLDLILLGLSFNNERAQMNISVSIPTGTEGQNVYFGARGLDVRPDGIDLGELKLFLAQDIGLSD